MPDGVLLGRERPPIPAEYTGLARDFRRRVLATDDVANAAIDRVTQPLRERLERKPALRPEMVRPAVAAWEAAMPATFRIDREVAMTRKALLIVEMRIVGSQWRDDDWEDAPGGEMQEPGVAIALLKMTTAHGRFRYDVVPIVTLSLHALARRYQRGVGRSDAELVRDLSELIKARPEDTEVPVLHGRWLGRVQTATDSRSQQQVPVRAIRTFLEG